MARKKQRKKNWFRTLVLLLLLPLIVWFLAFLLWFYWYDVSKVFRKDDARPARANPARQIDKIERRESVPARRSEERILDDDRKSLEDVLKRRN